VIETTEAFQGDARVRASDGAKRPDDGRCVGDGRRRIEEMVDERRNETGIAPEARERRDQVERRRGRPGEKVEMGGQDRDENELVVVSPLECLGDRLADVWGGQRCFGELDQVAGHLGVLERAELANRRTAERHETIVRCRRDVEPTVACVRWLSGEHLAADSLVQMCRENAVGDCDAQGQHSPTTAGIDTRDVSPRIEEEDAISIDPRADHVLPK
jgi:hypothetical protein